MQQPNGLSDLDKERQARIRRNNLLLSEIGIAGSIEETRKVAAKLRNKAKGDAKKRKKPDPPPRRPKLLRSCAARAEVEEELDVDEEEELDEEEEIKENADNGPDDEGLELDSEDEPDSVMQALLDADISVDGPEGKVLMVLARLKHQLFDLRDPHDLSTWLENARAMIAVGLRVSKLSSIESCATLVDNPAVVKELLAKGMPAADLVDLQVALKVEACPQKVKGRRGSTTPITPAEGGKMRMPIQFMDKIVQVFDTGLHSAQAYKGLEDKEARARQVVAHFGEKIMLSKLKVSKMSEVYERILKSAEKRARNTQHKRKSGGALADMTNGQQLAESDDGDDGPVVTEVQPLQPHRWPALPGDAEEMAEYQAAASHADYLTKFDISDGNGVVLAGSAKSDAENWTLVSVAAGLLVEPIAATVDAASSVKVLIIGVSNNYRARAVYLPPAVTGGDLRTVQLTGVSTGDGKDGAKLLNRFEVAEWPVTGILPRVDGVTGVRLAQLAYGLNDRAWNSCKVALEKARKSVGASAS